jgi:hypothetical protein
MVLRCVPGVGDGTGAETGAGYGNRGLLPSAGPLAKVSVLYMIMSHDFIIASDVYPQLIPSSSKRKIGNFVISPFIMCTCKMDYDVHRG